MRMLLRCMTLPWFVFGDEDAPSSCMLTPPLAGQARARPDARHRLIRLRFDVGIFPMHVIGLPFDQRVADALIGKPIDMADHRVETRERTVSLDLKKKLHVSYPRLLFSGLPTRLSTDRLSAPQSGEVHQKLVERIHCCCIGAASVSCGIWVVIHHATAFMHNRPHL